MSNNTTTLVELDNRRRASLGKVGRHSQYRVTEHPDGSLLFEPAVVMSEHEATLMGHPDLVESIQADKANPAQLVRRTI